MKKISLRETMDLVAAKFNASGIPNMRPVELAAHDYRMASFDTVIDTDLDSNPRLGFEVRIGAGLTVKPLFTSSFQVVNVNPATLLEFARMAEAVGKFLAECTSELSEYEIDPT